MLSLGALWSWQEFGVGSSLLLTLCDADNEQRANSSGVSWPSLHYKPQVHTLPEIEF